MTQSKNTEKTILGLTQEDQKRVRKFAITMMIFFLILAAVFYFFSKKPHIAQILGGIAAGFFVLGVPFPPLLWPFERFWHYLALVLAYVNTRLILSLVFYLLITPIGGLMRLFGKDFLSQKIDKNAETYWIDREDKPIDPQQYERLF